MQPDLFEHHYIPREKRYVFGEYTEHTPCIHAGPNGCQKHVSVVCISNVRGSCVDYHFGCAGGHTWTQAETYEPALLTMLEKLGLVHLLNANPPG